MKSKSNRAFALLNASTVWTWASTFGHGSYIRLTAYTTCVELEVDLSYDSFHLDRELVKYKQVVSNGAKFRFVDRPDLRINVLYITWDYDTEY